MPAQENKNNGKETIRRNDPTTLKELAKQTNLSGGALSNETPTSSIPGIKFDRKDQVKNMEFDA